jgi:serine kinase of HPr protein (carbohydrate metabolism regulator)
MTESQTTLHGTCLQVDGWGVLLLGTPGAGKSSLALHLIDQPGYGLSTKIMRSVLVADDQVVITRRGGKLVATVPPVLQGRLEIRGLGIVDVKSRANATLALVVNLQSHAKIERLPDAETYEILGVGLPLIRLDAATNSAAARLRAAVNWMVNRL